jgi:glycosyltransferase involved in cell wall biosynthesis
MKKSKVLFISPFILDGLYGGSMGSRSKMELLSNHFDVTTVSFPRQQDRNDALRADIELQGTTSKMATVLANVGLLSGRLTWSAMKQLKQIIASREHDLVFLDTSYYGWIARYCRRIGIPCVAMIHNVEYDFEVNRLKSGQWAYFPSFLAAWVNERLTTRFVNALISLHKEDALRLKAVYGREAEFHWPVLMKDTLAADAVLAPARDAQGTVRILFVGTSFYGNMEAVLFFINKVMPLIDRSVPVEFQIVGRGFEQHKDLEKLDPRVRIYGKVDSVEAFYQGAGIVVAPIFSGAGMKVKIAEAMMYGKPVIASQFALVGYEQSVDQDNLIRCDTPAQFADAVKRLVSAGQLASPRNREEFQDRYSYDAALRYIAPINTYLAQVSEGASNAYA